MDFCKGEYMSYDDMPEDADPDEDVEPLVAEPAPQVGDVAAEGETQADDTHAEEEQYIDIDGEEEVAPAGGRHTQLQARLHAPRPGLKPKAPLKTAECSADVGSNSPEGGGTCKNTLMPKWPNRGFSDDGPLLGKVSEPRLYRPKVYLPRVWRKCTSTRQEKKKDKWAISMLWTLMELSVIPVKRQLSLLSSSCFLTLSPPLDYQENGRKYHKGLFAYALLRELAGVTIPPERLYGLGIGRKPPPPPPLASRATPTSTIYPHEPAPPPRSTPASTLAPASHPRLLASHPHTPSPASPPPPPRPHPHPRDSFLPHPSPSRLPQGLPRGGSEHPGVTAVLHPIVQDRFKRGESLCWWRRMRLRTAHSQTENEKHMD
ncbi:hypothetical protein Fmac_017861 [Flemingia macrophylla]|uniref:Uncharacterized protein n=1 Tax=Flemingia macrophylla TaxID=520843 RepID=A0ABD1M3D9_9FABA